MQFALSYPQPFFHFLFLSKQKFKELCCWCFFYKCNASVSALLGAFSAPTSSILIHLITSYCLTATTNNNKRVWEWLSYLQSTSMKCSFCTDDNVIFLHKWFFIREIQHMTYDTLILNYNSLLGAVPLTELSATLSYAQFA
jgi:hypothetical protein